MQITEHTGLVLEGGGMRGVFTAGVLDALMKNEVYFPYVVAVSAGALHGLSYMSRQPRRARWSSIDMLKKYGYISLRSLVQNGSIFDPNILYERFPDEIIPFDYKTYENNKPPVPCPLCLRLLSSTTSRCSMVESLTVSPLCALLILVITKM